MDWTPPESQQYPVELLASNFRISGKLNPFGDLVSFINDPHRSTIAIKAAQVTPLQTNWRAGEFARDEIIIPKSEVQLLRMFDLNGGDLQLLPRTEPLIVYTDTYAVNGAFHLGPETRVDDIFYVTPGPFFPVSQVEVYAVMSLTVQVGERAPLAFLNRQHVNLFYANQPTEALVSAG